MGNPRGLLLPNTALRSRIVVCDLPLALHTEGDADMGFLKRSLRLGFSSVLLLAMMAIPSAWENQAPGTAFGPAKSWAGGTPDESLHPQPQPSGKRTLLVTNKGRDAATEASTTGAQLSTRDRLIALWTFVRAMSLRN